MWIMSQTKMGLVNTDNVIDFFIDPKRHGIVARVSTTPQEVFIGVGYYNNNDECLEILRDIFENLSITGRSVYIMPPREKNIQ